VDWLRLYTDILDDEKVSQMTDSTYRIFTFLMLLCRERDTKGVVDLDIADISWRLRRRKSQVTQAIKDLIALSILTDKEPYSFIHWSKRQFESDDVTPRVKRFRDAKRNVTRNVTPPRPCNVIDTEQNRTDTEQSRERNVTASIDNSEPEDNPPFVTPPPEPQIVAAPTERGPDKKEPENPKPKPGNGSGSGNTHGERWTPKQADEFEELMKDIGERIKPFPFQKVFTFTQTHYNRCNPEAMCHVLRSFIRETLAGKVIAVPDRWLAKAMEIENGKYEAAESERQHEALKAEESRDVGRLISGIGRSM
jgi:hypothetical protein